MEMAKIIKVEVEVNVWGLETGLSVHWGGMTTFWVLEFVRISPQRRGVKRIKQSFPIVGP